MSQTRRGRRPADLNGERVNRATRDMPRGLGRGYLFW